MTGATLLGAAIALPAAAQFAKPEDAIKYRKAVFTVTCTEDELAMKENALVSKAMRTLALRLLPGDIMDDCEKQIEETLNAKDKADHARQALEARQAAKEANDEAFKQQMLDAIQRVGPAIEAAGGKALMFKTGHSLIKAKMKEYGLTLADFGGASGDTPRKAAAKSKSTAPAKYRGPNGELWAGGLGRKPEWVRAVLADGKNISDYLI